MKTKKPPYEMTDVELSREWGCVDRSSGDTARADAIEIELERRQIHFQSSPNALQPPEAGNSRFDAEREIGLLKVQVVALEKAVNAVLLEAGLPAIRLPKLPR